MKKILPILSIVTRVLLGLVLVTALVLNLGMAYIMFAPDSFPKPFYLMYSDGTGVSLSPSLPGSETPLVTPTPEVTATPEPPEIKAGEGIMLNTGTKIINLADSPSQRFIRISIVMEFAPDDHEYTTLPEEEKTLYLTTFNEKLNMILPMIDDSIITILSTKKFEDLYTADGKESLRTELLEQVRSKLPDYEIMSVYFTEFVVE